jgi:hypothetical protein
MGKLELFSQLEIASDAGSEVLRRAGSIARKSNSSGYLRIGVGDEIQR